MTKVSRIKIDARHLGFFINNFWNLITLLENKDEVAGFLKDLLTHTEMKMFAKRIQIAKMLMEGYSYKTIKGFVKVTDPTVSKINNKLATGAEGLKTAIFYLQKIEKEIDKKRMSPSPDLKNRYPSYFLPEIVIGGVAKSLKRRRKRQSVKEYVVV